MAADTSTLLHLSMQCYVVLWRVMLYMPCYAISCYAMQRYNYMYVLFCNLMVPHVVLCRTIACYAVLLSAMICHVLPCCAMLCYCFMLWHAISCYAMFALLFNVISQLFVLGHFMPCYGMLYMSYYDMPCDAILYSAILCYKMSCNAACAIIMYAVFCWLYIVLWKSPLNDLFLVFSPCMSLSVCMSLGILH